MTANNHLISGQSRATTPSQCAATLSSRKGGNKQINALADAIIRHLNWQTRMMQLREHNRRVGLRRRYNKFVITQSAARSVPVGVGPCSNIGGQANGSQLSLFAA